MQSLDPKPEKPPKPTAAEEQTFRRMSIRSSFDPTVASSARVGSGSPFSALGFGAWGLGFYRV